MRTTRRRWRWWTASAVPALGAAAFVLYQGWATIALPEPYPLRWPDALPPPTTESSYRPVPGQPGKDVVWVPSAAPMVDVMLDLAAVTEKDTVIDLGSGDGRAVIAAAKRGARAIGIEFNPDLVALSTASAKAAGVAGNARFVHGDIFKSDLSDATVITMFLLPELNRRLRPALLDLKPGTRIVSNTFTLDDWMPDGTANAGGDCRTWCVALMWIVPAKVGGVWKLGKDTLTLTQVFQEVSGTLKTAVGVFPLENGRVRGTELEFTVNGVRYTGTVNGKHASGQYGPPQAPNPWSATRVKQE
jgi:SAM-dependent methyltransferase